MNSIIVCAAAIYGYTWAKVRLGPAEWRNNGSYYEEGADFLVIFLTSYFIYTGANSYLEAVEERITNLNVFNWFEIVKAP